MSVREKRPGYWEVRVYAGRDPITGKSRSVARGLRGTKREAKRLEASLVTDLSHHPVVDADGTLAYTCTEVDQSPGTDRPVADDDRGLPPASRGSDP